MVIDFVARFRSRPKSIKIRAPTKRSSDIPKPTVRYSIVSPVGPESALRSLFSASA